MFCALFSRSVSSSESALASKQAELCAKQEAAVVAKQNELDKTIETYMVRENTHARRVSVHTPMHPSTVVSLSP